MRGSLFDRIRSYVQATSTVMARLAGCAMLLLASHSYIPPQKRLILCIIRSSPVVPTSVKDRRPIKEELLDLYTRAYEVLYIIISIQ